MNIHLTPPEDMNQWVQTKQSLDDKNPNTSNENKVSEMGGLEFLDYLKIQSEQKIDQWHYSDTVPDG